MHIQQNTAKKNTSKEFKGLGDNPSVKVCVTLVGYSTQSACPTKSSTLSLGKMLIMAQPLPDKW